MNFKKHIDELYEYLSKHNLLSRFNCVAILKYSERDLSLRESIKLYIDI